MVRNHMEDTIMSEACNDKLNLNSVPIQALRIKSRRLLSNLLNGEQVIPATNGQPRDYRGIADLFGFDNFLMKSIEKSNDPMKVIIENVENQINWDNEDEKKVFTFQDLVDCLEKIERFDVIDDLMEQLKDDIIIYQKRMKKISKFGGKNKIECLTIDDESDQESKIMYDAYICYADEDIEFVSFLAQYLESPQIGLRLFIRDRDLLVGSMKYDAFTYLIEKRCNYVVIVLTPNFIQSAECEFQTRFATGLQIEQRSRKLIPIILKACEIPPCIRYISKIDFSRGDSKWQWVWRKLITSISSKPILFASLNHFPSIFSFPNNQYQIKNNEESSISSLLTVPQLKPPLDSQSSLKTEITNINSKKMNNLEYDPNFQITASNSNKLIKKNWIKCIKQKLTNLSSSESCSGIGYHSLNDSPSNIN